MPGLFFAAKSAMVVAVISLHGAAVAMYRSRAKELGPPHARRWQVLAAACLLTPAVGAGLVFIAFSSAAQFAVAVPLAVLLLGAHALWIIRSDAAFEEAATDAAEKDQPRRRHRAFLRPVVRNGPVPSGSPRAARRKRRSSGRTGCSSAGRRGARCSSRRS